MFCPNCGQQNPDNIQFCPNCGASQQNSQQQHTEQSHPVMNYAPPSQNNKWYQKTPAIILLLIVFFPVGLFLMWKYSNWSKVIKLIITAIIVILALFSLFGEEKADSPDETSTSASTTTIVTEQTTQIPTTNINDKNISALTDISNLTTEEAEKIIEDLKAAGIEYIDSASIIGSQSDADSGASFNVSYNGYSINLIVINRKTDYISSGDVVLFENGKVVDNINNYIISTAEKGEFIYKAKEYVLQGLKAPSTAEFPGTFLEIGEWNVTRNKDVVTVRSYVDSQNGFGAMIRSDFAVQMSYTDKSLLYMEIGDTVVYGEPH